MSDVIEYVKVSRTPTGMTVTVTLVHPEQRLTVKWGVKAYDGIPGAIRKGKAEARTKAYGALTELLEEESTP